jgi:hypothetical protein
MTTVYWLVRLRPGVTPEAYESFVRRVDYPAVQRIASIRSYRSNRVVGSPLGEASLPYDFVDVVEVADLPGYLNDLQHHPAVEEVHAQSAAMVEVVHCLTAEAVSAT